MHAHVAPQKGVGLHKLRGEMAISTFVLLLVSATATCCLASSYDLNACTYTDDKGKVYNLSPLIPKK